jgi:sulfotransferase 6B1
MNNGSPNLLPKVLVNSVPKSGTHLLLQIILGIPGMIITPAWIINKEDLELIKPGSVGPAHLDYSKEQVNILMNKNIKQIFISRDLRDIAVSLVHFVMLNKWGNHPWTPYLNSLKTHDERLLTMIRGVHLSKTEQYKYGISHIPNIKDFARNKLGWINEPDLCSVTFEELVLNPASQEKTILKIVDFLWRDLEHLKYSKEELATIIRKNVEPEKSGTFRKGRIGDWKSEFKNEHATAFKEIAGDLLIQLGYENDFSW